MATTGTRRPCNHASSSSRSGVVVPKVLTSRRGRRRSSGQRTQATTVSLWTSSPAQMGCRVSMGASVELPRRGAASIVSTLLCVFPRRGQQVRVREAARAKLCVGLRSTKEVTDLRPAKELCGMIRPTRPLSHFSCVQGGAERHDHYAERGRESMAPKTLPKRGFAHAARLTNRLCR